MSTTAPAKRTFWGWGWEGQGPTPDQVKKLAEIYPMCDVEVQNGGQPLYYYLLSVE